MQKKPNTFRLAGYAVLLAGMLGAGSAFAGPKVNQADASKLVSYVKSNGLACMSCHAVDHRVIGPPWAKVALRYHGKAHAEKTVSKAIANGSSGLWAGYPPMPSGLATPAQSKVLAKMILHLVN